MILKTVFSIKNLTVFGIAAFGLCLWAGDSMAQSEREKSEIEREKPITKPLSENHSDQVDMPLQDNFSPASTAPTPIVKTVSPKKAENQVSGEGKKVEPTPSTLSFNIFLYIVDKFKAD
ncbi:hypothetical protein [Algoriphagus winogradskyi]|uniref:Uncharacterized protein n=1 Tax=Algoriphagus winogradskyi TaxID=237017 RepID=A0ABY1NMC4_9BACT|nr:hypothetical protein [Algoriphagus winogradskyi]SMP13479.1 hypothetical protein SAMN06265367_102218 [Algoriphagus winogradskyi]